VLVPVKAESAEIEGYDAEVLVSVIMPCKDAAMFIDAAIASVLCQSHKELQLIVVDDGSTDQTVSLLESIVQRDPRVTLVRRGNNSGGPAAPRNIGMTHVKGKFIAFIDADDIWVPEKLAMQLAVMSKYELNFCSTLHRHFKHDAALPSVREKSLYGTKLVGLPHIQPISHATILRKNCIVTSGVMLRTTLKEHVHFSEKACFVAIEDYLAWLYLHQKPDVKSAIVQAPLVFYRTRKDSISSSKVEMTQKIYRLLSVYEIEGKPLGFMRFYYFATYLVGGVKSVVSDWFNRVKNSPD